jgi:hypothetical protein
LELLRHSFLKQEGHGWDKQIQEILDLPEIWTVSLQSQSVLFIILFPRMGSDQLNVASKVFSDSSGFDSINIKKFCNKMVSGRGRILINCEEFPD